jgi:hydroxymethylpyrimidine/phosphomethylpyrimidine kinase
MSHGNGRAGRPPVALTIAGSDPSGGAGVQADLKTFSALGAYGTAVLTALTAQSTRGVTGVHVVPAEFVLAQARTLVEDVAVDAAKIGMLGSAPVTDAVAEVLAGGLGCPVVLDPVMVSTSGSRLLDEDAVAAMRRLVPLADLVTPNLHEAAVLLDDEVAAGPEDMRRQAEALHERGAARVLVKGGHAAGGEVTDVLLDETGMHTLTSARVDTRNTHGTGCSLSSAIAALLPQRSSWLSATRDAKQWLSRALEAGRDLDIGHGAGPPHHFHALWPPR